MKIAHFSPVPIIMAGALAVALPALTPRSARACGGFWCSQATPVEQSAEQIIFVDNADETVSTVVQIQYAGPAERFAWVIPVPGEPEITVSSNIALQRLEQATAPQYTLNTTVEGQCMQEPFIGLGAAAGGTGAPPPVQAQPAADGRSPIAVVSEGSVGPYDYTVISVDPALDDPAQTAIDWFVENDYDLTSVDSELLGPYLAEGLNLLAFRLTKGNQSGSIRPVVLTYESELPMIPLRPTQVAVQDDMPIRVWVAGRTQAVSQNYRSLVINEALINWFNYRSNYDDVITAAADEAGGQGFVTELSEAMDAYREVVFSSNDEQGWISLMGQTYEDPIDAIWSANGYYRNWDGWRDAIEAAVSLPEDASFDDFGRNPDAYRGVAEVDLDLFFTELFEGVVKPVRDTQQLLNSRPHLTRLYSTMSGEEMTVDPIFNYNSDLADVSNVHVAMQFIECNPDVTISQAPWRIELPQGGVIVGEGNTFGWPIELDAMPANLKIVQLSQSGSGEVLVDNGSPIGDMLISRSGTMGDGSAVPAPPDEGVMIGGDQMLPGVTPPTRMANGSDSGDDELDETTPEGYDGGMCAVSLSSGGPAAPPVWVALLAGLALLRLRRRR